MSVHRSRTGQMIHSQKSALEQREWEATGRYERPGRQDVQRGVLLLDKDFYETYLTRASVALIRP